MGVPNSVQILRGNHEDLRCITQYCFKNELDIVDRGGHALEILLLLLAFRRDVPNSVQILRVLWMFFKYGFPSSSNQYLSSFDDERIASVGRGKSKCSLL